MWEIEWLHFIAAETKNILFIYGPEYRIVKTQSCIIFQAPLVSVLEGRCRLYIVHRKYWKMRVWIIIINNKLLQLQSIFHPNILRSFIFSPKALFNAPRIQLAYSTLTWQIKGKIALNTERLSHCSNTKCKACSSKLCLFFSL